MVDRTKTLQKKYEVMTTPEGGYAVLLRRENGSLTHFATTSGSSYASLIADTLNERDAANWGS